RPVVDREALLRVRDALTRFAAQARQQHQRLAESVRPNPSPMRVFVQSSEDRLAMAPDLAEPLPTAGPVPAPTPTVAPPTVAAATSVLAHRPAVLLAAVQRLQSHEPTADWAEAVLTRISALFGPAPLGDRESQNLLAELRLLTVEGYNAAPRVSDAALQSSWTRTVRALDRRLPVWQMLLEADVNRAANEPARQLGRDAALLATLREAAALIAGSEHGANWRQYLRLDELVDLASVAGGDFAEVRRGAARDVLLRISDARLSESQRHFLAQPPLSALALNLRPWASGPVALDALAMLVERYELNGSQADADALAELRMRMLWSDDPRLVVLADDLNRSYRNANVRVALADDMFNRMIPPQEPTVASVRERIGGADVRGRSRTETNVQLRLTPDPT
ncbi:MAG TPA: hypothetical protein PJ982_17855, partial [Lacipirellulaceae bacterium]|nr:hypothetical protein [Lacipirellulaceae bacterium]